MRRSVSLLLGRKGRAMNVRAGRSGLHILIAFGLFVTSLLLFSFFRRQYIWEWDGFGYVASTVLHERHSLVSGRWGTILFMIPFWEFHRLVSGLKPEDAWIATSQACMVASSLSVAFVYLLGRKMFSWTVGLIAAAFLAGSLGWVSYASANTSEMVMIAFGLAGTFLLFQGSERSEADGSWKSLVAGSFLIGYSVLAREQGLAFVPCAALLWFYNRKKLDKRFRRRLLLLPLIAVGVALSGPVYSFISEGKGYLAGFHNPGTEPKAGWEAFRERWGFLLDTWPYLFGTIPLLLSSVGTACLLLDREWKKSVLVLSLIAPACLHLFVGFLGIRYYLFVLPPLALLAAVGIHHPLKAFLKEEFTPVVPLGAAAILIGCLFWFHAKPEIARINHDLRQRKEFADNLLTNMPDKGFFILGHNDVMIDFFRKIGIRPGWAPLHFSWEPPKDRIHDIEEQLDWGDRVFIHPYALTGSPEDGTDLEEIRRKFDLAPTPGGLLYEIGWGVRRLDYERRRRN